mmetsp:Transcript_52167/g.59881  ORF Transcript_52167/g.59881 Transcript_52167/m.59881 type:complete len:233 (+) Transcript_52167:188-886(+)
MSSTLAMGCTTSKELEPMASVSLPPGCCVTSVALATLCMTEPAILEPRCVSCAPKLSNDETTDFPADGVGVAGATRAVEGTPCGDIGRPAGAPGGFFSYNSRRSSCGSTYRPAPLPSRVSRFSRSSTRNSSSEFETCRSVQTCFNSSNNLDMPPSWKMRGHSTPPPTRNNVTIRFPRKLLFRCNLATRVKGIHMVYIHSTREAESNGTPTPAAEIGSSPTDSICRLTAGETT